MAVPDFQSLMLPILQIIGDDAEWKNADIRQALTEKLALTEEDINELLPSGNNKRFNNRAAWAIVYLARAGLAERPGRGRVMISDEGRAVLADPPERITIAFLMKYPGMQEFRKKGAKPDPKPEPTGDSPEEILEANYSQIRDTLVADLLDQVKKCSPQFFENLVIDVLVAMGYGGSRVDAARAVGKPGDGGIDGIIKEDRLGLDQVYVQAKRWENNVGRPVVQAFAGSLEGFRARKGIMITTSSFTRDAEEYVTQIEKRIILIDGETLAEHMIDHGVGVSETARYVLHKIDTDYFEEQ